MPVQFPGPAGSQRGLRPGMILAFTLIILILMSLMGVTILLNTGTELNISSNTSLARNAFASADTAARLATLIGRILLHPELGPPDDIISDKPGPEYPLIVDIKIKELNLDDDPNPDGDINGDIGDINSDILDKHALRYRRAGDCENADICFKAKDEDMTVAAAALAVELDVPTTPGEAPVAAGMSLGGGDPYDGGGGAGLSAILAVSVNGRAINPRSSEKGPEKVTFDVSDEARSVITILYRELL